VESEIRAKGTRAFSYRVDVSKREQVYDTAQKVSCTGSRLRRGAYALVTWPGYLGTGGVSLQMRDEVRSPVTVLINNAGIVAGKPFLDGNDTYSLRTMEVGTARCVKCVNRHLLMVLLWGIIMHYMCEGMCVCITVHVI
jgi:NAD(P)-dependent dehydrogenase (short-subunit alcohol dehydrogenase family)